MSSESPDGMQLFRELLRYFGGAYVDEYYRNGSWDTELLELDLQLLQAHHRDAGCPVLKALEEIEEVILPELAPPPWRTDAAKRTPVGRGAKRRIITRENGASGAAVKRLRPSKGKGKIEQAHGIGDNGKASGKGYPLVPPPPPPVRRKGMLIPKRFLGNGSHTSSKAGAHALFSDTGPHTSSKASAPMHVPPKYGAKGGGKNFYGTSSVYSKASASTPAFSKSAGRLYIPLGGFARRRAAKLKASKEVTTLMMDPDFLD